MIGRKRGVVCERARVWASLAPDGELSSFELRLLSAHVERCAHCRAFADDVSGLTELVRTTPSDEIRLPVTVPGRERLLRRRRAGVLSVAASAAVVAIAVSIGASSKVSPQRDVPSAPLVIIATGADDDDFEREYRMTRRAQLLAETAAPSNSPMRTGVQDL
jgi:ferric-dicitrate binding protein FerR (iron transport regulator)